MKLTPETVARVAALARLELTGEETERMVADLGRILDYVAALDELDTGAVVPTSHVLPLTNVLREDEPITPLDRDEMLSGAPSSDRGHYRVPRVVGE